jgi:hypothetical protein
MQLNPLERLLHAADLPTSPAKAWTAPAYARYLGVGEDKVYGWIRNGELVAFNVATVLSGKPQWRISPEAAAEFERRRRGGPPPKPAPRKRRPGGEIDFYPDKADAASAPKKRGKEARA